MAELTVEQLIERFKLGGEWRVSQVASMCGCSIDTIYRYINEGKYGEGAVCRRGLRNTRIKGEAIAQFLERLNR
ncbi:MAG TPA: helix-turn-helix domain-containing protein [Acidobacteriota bacterium]|nr:helix-turn-helix domain-containing protein [Acidobacteriota bacterium]